MLVYIPYMDPRGDEVRIPFLNKWFGLVVWGPGAWIRILDTRTVDGESSITLQGFYTSKRWLLFGISEASTVSYIYIIGSNVLKSLNFSSNSHIFLPCET